MIVGIAFGVILELALNDIWKILKEKKNNISE